MKTESIELDQVNKDTLFLISEPIDSSSCETILKSYPYTNFILTDNKKRIIFGFEFIKYFSEQNIKKNNVLETNCTEKDALILAYNYKEKFFGFNTIEKLIFIKKALNFFSIPEIYKKTNIDISINEDLLKHLDLLLGEAFKNSLISERINIKSAIQICRWEKKNRDTIIDFFSKIPFSKSHQLYIIEMVEELIFKEKFDVERLFNKLDLKHYYQEEKPQKQIIEKIFSYRYPLYQKESELWERTIKELKLPQNVSISHYPFFEKKEMELKIGLKKIEDLKKIVAYLKKI